MLKNIYKKLEEILKILKDIEQNMKMQGSVYYIPQPIAFPGKVDPVEFPDSATFPHSKDGGSYPPYEIIVSCDEGEIWTKDF